MTREDIHSEISNLLKLMEINNNRMVLNDSTVEIDLEQMREHILKLYSLHDQLMLVHEEGEPEAPVKPEPKNVEPKLEVAPEPVVEPIPEPESDPEPVEEEPKPISTPPKPRFKPDPVPAPEPEKEPEPTPEPIVEETPIQPKVEEPPQPDPVKEVKVEAKKPEKKSPKKIPGQPVADVYQRLKNTKIESIKKGISISKRYEMQNELFDNDPEVYNESIKALDNANDLDEAMEYLESTLMVRHKWDEEDSLVEELRTLLVRRYM